MRRRAVAVAFLSFVAACGDGSSGEVDAAAEEELFEGGTLHLAECGYDLTTRVGATAPVLAPAVLGDSPAPKQVRLGIAADPSTSMVVLWRTADEESERPTLATKVRYGTDGSLDRVADGVTYAYRAGFNQNGELVRIHETHLCGLQPDTAYSYQVGGDDGAGGEVWSELRTFRTAPSPAQADAEVVFAVVGDSRDGYEIWGQIAEQIAAHSPDLILFTGDAVTIGQLQYEWEEFFDSAAELLAATPMISAHGNHEINSVNYYSLFAMPGDEENFGLRYGPAHVVILNDTPVASSALQNVSATVLDDELTANADAPWKLAMHHRALWSASRHGSDETLRSIWGPIYDTHEVDLVLNGHDHNYERSHPIRGQEVKETPAEGTVYVVTGGAGAHLYESGTGAWTAHSSKSHGFVILRLRAGMLDLKAFDPSGTQLDALAITKP